ncbi:MAG: hypothetical protein KGI38_10535 [Thaumarchaeota archaeon]|nr:hypothetical protein [Nitrososphaerota archaeon]
MKTEFLAGSMVTRSLKITGPTRMIVAAVSAAVALDGMVAILALGPVGQAVLFAVLFASLAAGSWAVSVDVLKRSSQAVDNLRSIGASSGAISSAVAGSLIVYGAGGSALGAVVGAGLGLALLGSGTAVASALLEAFAVVVASSAAITVGVYGGGRAVWHS